MTIGNNQEEIFKYLHVVSFVVITALSKQSMRYDVVDIKLIKHRIRILNNADR